MFKNSNEEVKSNADENETISVISDTESVDLLVEDRPYHLLEEGSRSQEFNQSQFKDYGISIMNFLELHRQLAWMFFALSCLAIIQMLIYRFMGGLDYLGDNINPLAKYSFGNFGFSTTNCGMNLIDWQLETTNLHF